MKDIDTLLKATHNYGFWKGIIVGFILAMILVIIIILQQIN